MFGIRDLCAINRIEQELRTSGRDVDDAEGERFPMRRELLFTIRIAHIETTDHGGGLNNGVQHSAEFLYSVHYVRCLK